MRVEEITLTPDKAKELLGLNANNRHVHKAHVAFLAEQMRRGLWMEDTGDTIVIDTDGYMFDGQHRCHAVIDAGYVYNTLVVFDADPESRITKDSNAVRRFSDDLTIAGEKNATAQEALLRKIVTWKTKHGFAGHSSRVARAYLAKEYPLYAKDIRKAVASCYRFSRAPMSTGVTQFMYWLLTQNAPEDMVERYLSILSIGSQAEDDAALVRLRSNLEKVNEMQRGPQQASTYVAIWHLIRGWNAWVTGSTASYQLPKGGIRNPYPAPIGVEK